MRERLYLSLLISVLLGLAGWTAHARLQRSAPARQAWEYKTHTFDGPAGDWKRWSEDSTELPPPANGTAKRVELGSQGWELVSVATLEDTIGTSNTYTKSMTQF